MHEAADLRSSVHVGLSLMPSEDARLANEELFEQGVVDAIEWSVDFGMGVEAPDWVQRHVRDYAARGRAYAHGVELSPMSAELAPEQHAWLAELSRACAATPYRHLTEHYGFITAGDFVRGTPLPLPPSRAALRIASERVQVLRETSKLPVGIENLAFAFSVRDVFAQADFVRALCEASDAFVLLDVHNLFCQAVNFAIDPLEIARRYPLDRVREIHFAGGGLSWPASDEQRRAFRRDSHDAAAPSELFPMLEALLPELPALEVVILERSDRSLFGRAEADRHREEFRALRSLVKAERASRSGVSAPAATAWVDDDGAALESFQRSLLGSLEQHADPQAAKEALVGDAGLAIYREHIESYEPRAIEIGISLVRQWASRRPPVDSMIAAVFRDPGAPLEMRALPIPKIGPRQVLLRATAVGLCGTDAHAFAGRFPLPLPIVLGHETVGVVEAVGGEVSSLVVGDRVGVSWVQAGCGHCNGCRRGLLARCVEPRTWVENGGGLSELVVAEASGCTRLPDGLDDLHAAPLFCAGHVAMSGFRRATPQAGDRVAVLGVGGLGHLAIQIARAHGCEVIAVSASREKLDDARALGATEAVLAEGDVGLALESAGGADVVLATTNDATAVSQAVRGLRAGGRLVMLGLANEPLAIDPLELVQREASLIGAVQGTHGELLEVLELAARGLVLPRVEQYPLVLVQRALERLVAGRVRYRAVISG